MGAYLEAAGDGDFDFPRGEVEDDGDATATTSLAGDHALEAGERVGLADEYPEPGGGAGHHRVERLDFLCGQPHAFLFAAHVDRDDQRLTGIEQGAGLPQNFREQRYLEGAARIGHLNKGETVAAARGALLAADHNAGDLEAGRRAGSEAGRQLGPADDPGAF